MLFVTIVKGIGTLSAAIGLILCGVMVYLHARLRGGQAATPVWTLGVSAAVLYKWLAFGGFFAAPFVTAAMANYHLFEGTREVESCARCHVMRPIVNDMMNPESQTLAARHYRNRWIAKQQCYTCHTDYGLYGSIKAKQDGFRHLVKYVTRSYDEPIQYPYRYNNANCLQCHEGTDKFERVPSHTTVRARLKESSISCTNCHGIPHPTSEERTPGHPSYDLRRPR